MEVGGVFNSCFVWSINWGVLLSGWWVGSVRRYHALTLPHQYWWVGVFQTHCLELLFVCVVMRIYPRGSLGLKYVIYWPFWILATGVSTMRILSTSFKYITVTAFMGLFFLPYLPGCSGSRFQKFIKLLWGIILRVGAVSLVPSVVLVW